MAADPKSQLQPLCRDRVNNGFIEWVNTQSHIKGVALAGSHARKAATAGSDIDLIVFTENPSSMLKERSWLANLGTPLTVELGDYGALTSVRIFYDRGIEAEFGIASSAWARISPDPGTAEVVAGGFQILLDPESLFERLEPTLAAV